MSVSAGRLQCYQRTRVAFLERMSVFGQGTDSLLHLFASVFWAEEMTSGIITGASGDRDGQMVVVGIHSSSRKLRITCWKRSGSSRKGQCPLSSNRTSVELGSRPCSSAITGSIQSLSATP